MRALAASSIALLALAWLACSDAPRDAVPRAESDSGANQKASSEPVARRGPPLPAFEGATLDGQPLSLGSLLGKRLILFGFNPDREESRHLAAAMSAVASERAAHNFEIVAVAAAESPSAARSFLEAHGIDGPALYDPSGTLAGRLRIPNPVFLVFADAEGSILNQLSGFSAEPESAQQVERMLRDMLRLPTAESASAAPPGVRPNAPLFSATRMDGGAPFRLAEQAGRPTVLVFFLHTCPHCHSALRVYKDALATISEEKRPTLVGISVLDRPLSVDPMLKELGLDFFPVYVDPDSSIRSAYGALSGVPAIILIDAEGKIAGRTTGWRDDRDPPLARMRLAQIAGLPVPMLLHKTGYSGSEFCGVCHAQAEATWNLTNHASAYDTLVRHGADAKGECVSCHVVGFAKDGGYDLAHPEPALEDVGCETCHGRGGPHLSPDHVKDHQYEAACKTCHNPEHSLGFDYASFLPQVSHAANLQVLALPEAEREKLLTGRKKPRSNLLPTTADYVGSAACQSCHAQEHATWSQHPHANAHATLAAKGEAGNADCLVCHTTALGRPGGFAADAKAEDHPQLAAVGCESCHGPGGEHVKPESTKRGSIVSLGDKCDSCVILQICGSCHDDANDPGFEFEVLDKIEKQRHGTIEAGTGKPLGAKQAALPAATALGLLSHALAEPRS